MKLSSENINIERNKIDRDIRMLECIESMYKKMEYEVSCEDPNVSYISIDGIRLIFEDGVYKGRYVFKEETKKSEPDKNIDILKNTIRSFFSGFLHPFIDVDICECNYGGFQYIKITVYSNGYSKHTVTSGTINTLAALPTNKFLDILENATWVH